MLNALDREEGGTSPRNIIEVLISSSAEQGKHGNKDDTYLRFINWLQMNHRQLFLMRSTTSGTSATSVAWPRSRHSSQICPSRS
jgi:hypothetical protein